MLGYSCCGSLITDIHTKDCINNKADPIVSAVRDDLLRRSELGINKYGKTLDRTDLSLRDWLQHAYEENLDLCNYLKRCIIEIDDNEITKMMMQEPTPKQHT